jgi:hypothetical protein
MSSPPSPTRSQKLVVGLAFVAAAVSLTAALLVFVSHGAIAPTQLFGGILMLVLGISGYFRLRNQARTARVQGRDAGGRGPRG